MAKELRAGGMGRDQPWRRGQPLGGRQATWVEWAGPVDSRLPAASLLGWRESRPTPRWALPSFAWVGRKNCAGPANLMAAAACGIKAMSLFKRTLVLSPTAAPRATSTGISPRGCSLPPTTCPSKDWPRREGVCRRLWSPTAAGHLPQSQSCSSTSPTSVCLLCPQDSLSSSLKTCYKYLRQTSRSFASVIQALDEEMR